MERKQYTPEYKAKIVLEMLREETSVSEMARRENINKNQLQNWKKEFIENSARVFAQNKIEKEAERKIKELEEKEREYQAKVGQLVIENDWLKKNMSKCMVPGGKQRLVASDEKLTVTRQCELLGIKNRTSVYYEPKQPTEAEVEREELIKARIDYWHTKYCCFGVRKLRNKLNREDGLGVGRKLIARYMEEMGIYCIYPKPNLSKTCKEHKKFGYLLRNM